MEFRHKAFAHSDFTGPLPGHGKMTEVRLVFDGRTVADFSSRPIFEPVLLPHIKALADLLAQKVKESHDNFLNRVLRVIVPQFTEADVGREFELNVEDEKGPMVVRSSEPIAGNIRWCGQCPKSASSEAGNLPSDTPKTVLTLDWRKRVDARARVQMAIEDVLDEGLPRASRRNCTRASVRRCLSTSMRTTLVPGLASTRLRREVNECHPCPRS